MKESGKERPESGKNAFPDEVQRPFQDVLHWLTPPYESFVERYKRGDLSFELQLTADYFISGRWESRYFVAIVEHPCRHIREHRDRSIIGFHKSDVGLPYAADDGSEVPVLVSVREVVENPEGVSLRVLPHVVRLQVANDRDGPGVERGNDVHASGIEAGLSLKDREAGLVVWGPVVSEGQGINEVVEGAPGVVDNLTYENGNLWRGQVDDLESDAGAVVLLIKRESVRIAFDIQTDLGPDRSQLCVRSVQLVIHTGGPRHR